MQYLKNQGRVTKIQDLVHTLKTQYRTESVIADLSKTGVFNAFSEEPKKRPSKNWRKSNHLNWETFLRKYNALRAPSTGQKDCKIALAEYVSGLPKNRSAK